MTDTDKKTDEDNGFFGSFDLSKIMDSFSSMDISKLADVSYLKTIIEGVLTSVVSLPAAVAGKMSDMIATPIAAKIKEWTDWFGMTTAAPAAVEPTADQKLQQDQAAKTGATGPIPPVTPQNTQTFSITPPANSQNGSVVQNFTVASNPAATAPTQNVLFPRNAPTSGNFSSVGSIDFNAPTGDALKTMFNSPGVLPKPVTEPVQPFPSFFPLPPK